jgi:CheY-like chemotaxis protein
MRQNSARSIEPDQDARRHPRQRVSWLVTVAAGARQYHGRTKDISASGVKILLKERPPLGAEVALCFRPPGRRAVETRALVWRVDGEGLAAMFVGTQTPDFLEAVTPPMVRTSAPAKTTAPARTTPPARTASPPRPPAAPAPVLRSATPSAATVLLASADMGLRALAVEALGRAGYTVLDAGSQPLLALRMAEEHRGAISLVLIAADLRLMNGDPLATRITPLLPGAKVVLMSGRSHPADSTAHWLPTPCTDGELLDRVRHALS